VNNWRLEKKIAGLQGESVSGSIKKKEVFLRFATPSHKRENPMGFFLGKCPTQTWFFVYPSVLFFISPSAKHGRQRDGGKEEGGRKEAVSLFLF
jgi:hypothetical protein